MALGSVRLSPRSALGAPGDVPSWSRDAPDPGVSPGAGSSSEAMFRKTTLERVVLTNLSEHFFRKTRTGPPWRGSRALNAGFQRARTRWNPAFTALRGRRWGVAGRERVSWAASGRAGRAPGRRRRPARTGR